jgi:MFS family permease
VAANRDLRLLSLSLFLWALGEGLFIFILPIFMTELGATPAQIGQIYSIGAVAMAVSLLPAGWAADRFGSKVVLVSGWAAGISCAFFFAISHSIPVFLVGWLLYRVTAWVIPGISTYTTNARGDNSAGRALTNVYSMFHAGLIVSPTIGGYLGQAYGLRVNFWVALVLFTASTVVILFLRYQAPHPVEQRAKPSELLSSKAFLTFLSMVFLVMVIMYLGYDFAPKFVSEVKHIELEQIGWLGTMNALGGFVLNQYLGRRPPRWGLIVAMVLVFIHAIVMLQAGWIGWFALAYFMRGAVNVIRSLFSALMTFIVKPSQLGVAFGLIETVSTSGEVVGPYFAGLLYESAPSLPFVVMIALCPVALGLIWWLAPKKAAYLTPSPLPSTAD